MRGHFFRGAPESGAQPFSLIKRGLGSNTVALRISCAQGAGKLCRPPVGPISQPAGGGGTSNEPVFTEHVAGLLLPSLKLTLTVTVYVVSYSENEVVTLRPLAPNDHEPFVATAPLLADPDAVKLASRFDLFCVRTPLQVAV